MYFLKIVVLILLIAKNSSESAAFILENFLIKSQVNETGKSTALESLIETIEKQRHVETLFVLTNGGNLFMDVTDNVLKQWPKLIWNTNTLNQQFIYKSHYNKEILVLLIFKEFKDNVTEIEMNKIWYSLGQMLNEMRHVTRLLVNFSQQKYNEIMLHKMFELCINLKFLHINVIFEDFQDTQLLYGFEPFAQYPIRVSKYDKNSNVQIYGNVLQNLNGMRIKSIADQIEPRSLLYIDENGEQQLTGYLVNLLKVFAQKHNGTLVYPYPMHVGKVLFYSDVAKHTRAGLLDLPASMVPSTGLFDATALTYPYEQMNYCLMVPEPPHMPVSDIYLIVVDPIVNIVHYCLIPLFSILCVLNRHSPTYVKWKWNIFDVINLEVVRVFADQPIQRDKALTSKMKFLYLQILWLVFLFNGMYSCYLGSLLTCPPVLDNIQSMEDFAKRNISIFVAEKEWKIYYSSNHNIESHWQRAFRNSIVKLVSFEEFLEKRKSMSTAYAYPVTSSRWFYFQERQKIFERPLFYYDKNFCFSHMVLLSIPLQNNSIYVEAINRITLQVHQSGLMRKWMSQNFFDMVKLKRIPLDDLSPPLTYGGKIDMEDLRHLFMFLYSFLGLSFLCFLCECYWKFIKNCFAKINFKSLKFKKTIKNVSKFKK